MTTFHEFVAEHEDKMLGKKYDALVMFGINQDAGSVATAIMGHGTPVVIAMGALTGALEHVEDVVKENGKAVQGYTVLINVLENVIIPDLKRKRAEAETATESAG